jgi:putative glutamine amidotransferase
MTKRKPVIGIPVNVLVEKHGPFAGMERASVNQDYLDALKAAGAVPVALPMVEDAEDIAAQLGLVDGLLFSGGADMSPFTYDQQPEPGLDEVYPDMDRHQLALARSGRAAGLPMLGICRGMQVLNVAWGGTLHQDLGSLNQPLLQHWHKGQRRGVSHTVDLVDGTRLRRIFGCPSLGTNSFHHQAVKVLAPGLTVSARARDGVIEGLEAPEGFLLGVQWHPEGMVATCPDMLRVFQALVLACAQEEEELR